MNEKEFAFLGRCVLQSICKGKGAPGRRRDSAVHAAAVADAAAVVRAPPQRHRPLQRRHRRSPHCAGHGGRCCVAPSDALPCASPGAPAAAGSAGPRTAAAAPAPHHQPTVSTLCLVCSKRDQRAEALSLSRQATEPQDRGMGTKDVIF